MANIMMPPVANTVSPGKTPDAKSQIEPERESSFSNYMDKKLRHEEREKRSLLGANEKNSQPKETDGDSAKKADDTEAALLQRLMGDLQKLLKDDSGKAGEWTFALDGLGILEKLASFAGMDGAELSLLKKQMDEKGSIALCELFAALEKHFSLLSEDLQVTVPETNLAFLESLLAKMGLSSDEISALSDEGVNGLSELDLIAYLKALEQLDAARQENISLSDWELEQLQSMLGQAGMSGESLSKLIPEVDFLLRKGFEALGLENDDIDVNLSLERLKNLLEQAIADADAAKVKANVPGFVEELKGLLAQAGFEGKTVGWSPVIQESMTAVYQELQKMVDLSKVKIEKLNETQNIEADLAKEWLSSGKTVAPEQVAQNGQEKASDFLFGSNPESTLEEIAKSISSEKPSEKSANNFISHLNSSFQETSNTTEQRSLHIEERFTATRTRLTPDMQQFSVDQISQGVMRGLRNSLHQLTLTLYPKELGEVKVDLQVRESHVSVSFVMESSQVKEALESNMQDFKDNLNKQGFSLHECFVSVDQNNSDEARRRFEEAWERMVAQTGYEKDHGLPNEVMAMVGERHVTMHQGNTISLFV